MVVASHRWLGVRLDSLSALLTGVVALAALFVAQDAGKYNLDKVNREEQESFPCVHGAS